MLPQQRAAATGVVQGLVGYDQPGGHEEAGAGQPVHELKDTGRFEWWEGQQEQERRDQLRPHEEREPHEAEPRGAELNNGDEEVDCTEE